MAILIFLSHICLSGRSGMAETIIKAAAFGRNCKAFVLSLPTNQPQNPVAPAILNDGRSHRITQTDPPLWIPFGYDRRPRRTPQTFDISFLISLIRVSSRL